MMKLREALEHLSTLGTEQTVPKDIDAGIVLGEALAGFDGEAHAELAIRPAGQAQALELVEELTGMLRTIVYDMARYEVLNQVLNIARDATAAREEATAAASHYQATRTTWDRLAERLVAVEFEVGLHVKGLGPDRDAEVMWKRVESLAGMVAGRDGLLGVVGEYGKRVETLEGDQEVHSDTRVRVGKLEAGAAATLTDIGQMSTAEGHLVIKLDKLVARVKELDGHGVKARASLCDRITDVEQKLKDLGEHPAPV